MSGEQQTLVDELLLDWQEAHDAGRDISATELCRECPELLPELERQLVALRKINALVAPAAAGPDAGATAMFLLPPLETPDRPEPQASGPAPVLPGLQVLGGLGGGGMGVVYKARQASLDRLVALKVIRSGALADELEQARFHREAQIVAGLRHPNVVQVYEFGTCDGLPYFTMEYLDGGSLADRISGVPRPPQEAAGTVEVLARAVQHAHEQGVIHRDLKPANVLLTADGTVKVSDFGLAHRTGSDLTNPSAILGTPSYMAPEQACGGPAALGPEADVYALGAILYELLTGRPPFNGTSAWDTIQLVVSQEPVPPRRLQPHVPRDLETICLKCLQKEPRRRYATAGELADDLRRILDGLPVLARPVGHAERLLKWGRRHRALTALYAVSVAAALALLVVGAYLLRAWADGRTLEAEKLEAEAREEVSRGQAANAKRLADSHRFFGLMNRVRERVSRPSPGWTWENLEALKEAASLPDAADKGSELRSELATSVGACDVRLAATLAKGTTAQSLAWHPDGRTLALGERAWGWLTCGVLLVDPADPGKSRRLSFAARPVKGADGLKHEVVQQLAFSPDGRWLVAGTRGGRLVRWNLAQAGPSAVNWSGHDSGVDAVLFSADGASLYTSAFNSIKRWDTATWALAASTSPGGPIGRLALTPEGSVVVCPAFLRLFEGHSLKPTRPEIKGLTEGLAPFALAGQCVAVGAGTEVRLFDLETRRVCQSLSRGEGDAAHDGDVRDLALHPAGDLLLSASSEERHVRLWQRSQGRLVADLVVGGGSCKVSFAPDGRRFAVAGEKETRLYEVRGSEVQAPDGLHHLPLYSLAAQPGGESLAVDTPADTRSRYAEVRVWPAGGQLSACGLVGETLPSMERQGVALAPDGRWAACEVRDGSSRAIQLMRLDTGELFLIPSKHHNSYSFAPDGRLWVAAAEARVLVHDVPKGSITAVFDDSLLGKLSGLPGIHCVAVGPRWAVAGGRDGSLRVLPTAGKGALTSADRAHLGDAPLRTVALAADERHVLTGDESGKVHLCRLTELGKCEPLARAAGHRDRVVAVALASSGLAVSGGHDGDVILWHAGGELRRLLTLRLGRPVVGLALLPDGARLAVLLRGERAVRLWRLDLLRESCEQAGLGEGLGVIGRVPARRSPAARPVPEDKPKGPTGLRTEIFSDRYQVQPARVRYDALPRYDLSRLAQLDPAVSPFHTSVRWTGWLKAPRPGRYVLVLEHSQRARLWLDGQLLADGWYAADEGRLEVEVDLTDRPHALRIDYRKVSHRERAQLQFRWKPPGQPEEAVPPSALSPLRCTNRAARLDWGRRSPIMDVFAATWAQMEHT